MSYLKHFDLLENPFKNSNDEKYYYENQSSAEALSRLNLLLEMGGILHLYGKYGVGKTILLEKFIRGLSGHYHPVLISYTAVQSYCFLLQLSRTLGLPNKNNTSNLVTQIQEYINNSNQHIIFIIDEAQDLHGNALESLKLIVSPNLCVNRFNLIISSLPEMKDKLTTCPALKQRVTLHYQLCPLNITESKEYIKFRLKTAHCSETIFSDSAVDKIVVLAEGVPREINKITSLALIAAAAGNKKFIDLPIIELVATELSLY